MMENLKVSVILPIYNVQNYLKECLDSIITQTLADIEIICVNDGSTDNSGIILKEYASADKRIKIIEQDNQGPGVARNKGLQEAHGEYLALLDSDDIFDKNMLELLYGHAKENNLDVVVCRCEGFYNNILEKKEMRYALKETLLPNKHIFSGRDIKKNYFNAFVWWPWDKLYRREYIESLKLQFSTYRNSEDLYFVCIAVLMADKMAYIDDVLVKHRLNVHSSVSTTREISWDCFYWSLLDLRKFLLENNLYERYEQDFVNYCLDFSLWHLDTIKGKSYYLLYSALKNEWYGNLNVTGHNKEYFYNQQHYERLCIILKENLENLVQRCYYEETEIKRLKKSIPFRIGRAVTWGPRKIRSGVRCYNEHGIAYTIKRLGWHITNLK